MGIILHIDTATEYGAVAISNKTELIAVQENNNQKEHASFLHPAISKIMKDAKIANNEVDAIAVTIGPGSYTGLRVGLTAAKGLCYVLQKPLIAVSTLHAMALASVESTKHINFIKPPLYAPMIDARRMEVYTGLYTKDGGIYSNEKAVIVDENMYAAEAGKFNIIFSGSGSNKMKTIVSGNQFLFTDSMHSIYHVSAIAYEKFLKNEFVNSAYAKPFYAKQFYSPGFVKKE